MKTYHYCIGLEKVPISSVCDRKIPDYCNYRPTLVPEVFLDFPRMGELQESRDTVNEIGRFAKRKSRKTSETGILQAKCRCNCPAVKSPVWPPLMNDCVSKLLTFSQRNYCKWKPLMPASSRHRPRPLLMRK